MKKIIGRVLIILPGIILQVAWYFLFLWFVNDLLGGHLGDILNLICGILAVLFVTSLVAKRDESAYKMLWIILIVALPILGGTMYLMLGNKKTGKKLKRKLTQSSEELKAEYSEGMIGLADEAAENIRKIKEDDLRVGQIIGRVSESSHFPVVKNETAKYYRFGQDMLPDLLEDLKKAKKYIFVEYFIIERGKFWDSMVEVMAERVKDGVDCRVMYDDFGSIAKYSAKDVLELRKKGIKCIPFNPFFSLKSQLNNRDHRKITVIDGMVAYSGGVNLADEYINEIHPYGVWKDLGFRLTGESVRSYTYMFAEFWNAFSHEKIHRRLYEAPDLKPVEAEATDGYVVPYYDSPMRDDHTSNELYVEMLSMAKDYVWFYTPYLMPGDALFDAFIRAAKRGVDVRLIMPGIPDQKLPDRLAKTYYEDLLRGGVKIYLYTPGFVHAKASLADDVIGTVGTVNLDYRSLFLHFECNSLFYKAEILKDLKADYLKTQEECEEITLESLNHGKFHKFVDNLLRLATPLM
jgi:cardiolipin synthase